MTGFKGRARRDGRDGEKKEKYESTQRDDQIRSIGVCLEVLKYSESKNPQPRENMRGEL
jgi:hypothetical protein